MQRIKIKYLSNRIDRIKQMSFGDFIDLRAAETIHMKAGEFKLIPLGVAMKLPDGFYAEVVPRSSTFKNYGILQANSCGIIDNSYCGDDDQWMFPAYATRDTVINANDRICQFRVRQSQPEIEFVVVNHLGEQSRGGFGSTGKS